MSKNKRIKEENLIELQTKYYKESLDKMKGVKVVKDPTFYISILAVLISLVSFFVSYTYAKKEYEYKIDPEYDFYEKISIEDEEIKIKDFRIEISKENNLENIYILNSNGKIEKKDFNKGYIDLEINDYYKVEFENTKQIYRYVFMITESIDEELEILLVCSNVDSKTNETNTFIKNYLELYEFRNEEIGKVIFNQYNDLKNYIKEYKLN